MEPLRRPLIGLCITVLAGTGAGLFRAVPPGVLFLLAAGCLLLSLLPRSHERLRPPALFGAVFFVAWIHAGAHAHFPPGDDLSRWVQPRGESIDVRGIIDTEIRLVERDESAELDLTLDLTAIRRTGRWQSASGRLRCRWEPPESATLPAYGETWQLRGAVHRRAVPDARSSVVAPYRMTVWGESAFRRSGGGGSTFLKWCAQRREACARILTMGLEDFPGHAGLLKALLLGYRQDLPDAEEEQFARTGTLHIFAISGLHVAVMGSILIAILQALGVARYRWIFLLAPILVVYAVMTGMKPSAMRACVMAILYWSSAWVWRKPDAASALALAGILILAFDPGQLFEPGFILSFTVVCGLILLGPPLFRRINTFGGREPWAPRDTRAAHAWYQGARVYVVGLVATSIAAWSVSMPLTAHYFNLFSPVALLGNLLVIPMTFVILLTGCLSLLTGALLPTLAEIFNHANRVFVSVVLQWINCMDVMPGGHRLVASPPWPAMAAWFAALALLPFTARPRFRFGLCAVLIGCLVMWLEVVPGRCRAVDLLGGDRGVTLVLREQPGRCVVMLGEEGAWHEAHVVRYLRGLGIDRVDVLMLSGAATPRPPPLVLLETLRIGEVWTTGTGLDPEAWPEEARFRRLVQGDRGFFERGTQWDVQHPPLGWPTSDVLGMGWVARFGWMNWSCMVAGAGGAQVEDQLLAGDVDSGCGILVCADDRGTRILSDRWLQSVQPSSVVLATGKMRWRTDDHARIERLAEQHHLDARFLRPGEGIRFRLPNALGQGTTDGLLFEWRSW